MRDKPKTDTSLLIIDMISELSFPEAEAMRGSIEEAAEVVLRLRAAADAAKAPVIYVNDNYGQWHLDRDGIVAHARKTEGAWIAERLAPRASDYFVVKPQVSGFYATTLQALLPRIGVTRLVLTGIAADICVLFTAADAHMREYDLWVPADAVASSEDRHRDWALGIMGKSMGAETRPTTELAFNQWMAAQD